MFLLEFLVEVFHLRCQLSYSFGLRFPLFLQDIELFEQFQLLLLELICEFGSGLLPEGRHDCVVLLHQIVDDCRHVVCIAVDCRFECNLKISEVIGRWLDSQILFQIL